MKNCSIYNCKTLQIPCALDYYFLVLRSKKFCRLREVRHREVLHNKFPREWLFLYLYINRLGRPLHASRANIPPWSEASLGEFVLKRGQRKRMIYLLREQQQSFKTWPNNEYWNSSKLNVNKIFLFTARHITHKHLKNPYNLIST